MKKTIYLLLWALLLSLQSAIAYVIPLERNLDEYIIKTKDEKCTLRYLSPVPVPQDWYIYISDDKCLDNGFHEVHLLDTDKVVRDSLSGYFLDGYFIGNTPLNHQIFKRASYLKGTQLAFYKIDTDNSLKIEYIGQMSSSLQNSLYPAFNLCNPFHIIALTDNKKLFQNQEILNNLFMVSKSYAQNICPQVSSIIFEATDNISNLNSPFARFSFENGPSNTWLIIPEQSFNSLSLEKENTLQKKKLVKQIYSLLQELPPYDRPAFLFGKFKIDFPYHLMIASHLLDIPTKGTFVIHVSQKNENNSWADYPFPILVNETLDEGWFLVDAWVSQLSTQEKKKAGISWKKPAAQAFLTQKQKCLRDYCSEWENTAYLLEKKYNLPRSEFLP